MDAHVPRTPPTFAQRCAGATSNSYVTAASVIGDSGAIFDVSISNAAGSVTSSTAVLTVTSVALAPTITKQPLSASAPNGGAVAFSVGADGTAPFTYQWRRNNVAIPNETNPTLVVSPVSILNNGNDFTVAVTNAAGSIESAPAVLSVTSQSGQIELLAGLIGGPGNVDGTGSNAHFANPMDIAVDNSGNLYIADAGNRTVRKMTPSLVVSTLAGNAGEDGYIDGIGASARFRGPGSVGVDAVGNVFVMDGDAIRKIALDGTVTTLAGDVDESGFADGSGASARFNFAAPPWVHAQLAVAATGDVYVGDCGNHVVRRITSSSVVSTYAGSPGQSGSSDGDLAAARFNCPSALDFDSQGNLYVADSGNHTLRKITAADSTVSTLAGTATQFGNRLDGTGAAANFASLRDMTVDNADNIFVGDATAIRRVTPAGVVTTVSGDQLNQNVRDGTGMQAAFGRITGMASDTAGNVFIVHDFLDAIRKMSPAYVVTTLPGGLGQRDYAGFLDGPAAGALFNRRLAITADASGNVYLTDPGNCALRKIASNVVSTVVGEPSEGLGACSSNPAFRTIEGLSFDNGSLYVGDYVDGYVARVTTAGAISVLAGTPGQRGYADGVGAAARFSGAITGIATDGNGNVYVADSNNNVIRKIVIATQAVSTLAGNASAPAGTADGTGAAARFDGPCGIDADRAGNVYVAECVSGTIRKVTPAGVVTTIAGKANESGYVDGDTLGSLFSSPVDVAVDEDGNLYVADTGNYLVRKITPSGIVSTVAGTRGLMGQMVGPCPALWLRRSAFTRANFRVVMSNCWSSLVMQ
jgi:hypothetical protein